MDEAETTLRRRIEEIEGGYDRVWQMTAKAWRNATAEVRETLAAVWEESVAIVSRPGTILVGPIGRQPPSFRRCCNSAD